MTESAALRPAPGVVSAALLDESVVSGVSVDFCSEALHAVGIDRHRPYRY